MMSNTEQGHTNGVGTRPAPEAEMASSFRLRPERPHVTRLSRNALIGGTALALTLISAAVLLALQTRGLLPRTNSTPPITTMWRTSLRACLRTTAQFRPKCQDWDLLCPVIWAARLSPHKTKIAQLRSMPSSNGSIRRVRQLAPAMYLRIPLRAPHVAQLRQARAQVGPLQPTLPLFRTVKTVNVRSLMLQSTDEPLVLSDW
jgi:hypothetical protein